MATNLVQLSDLALIDKYASLFGDSDVIVARDFSEKELSQFNAQKRGSKTKIYSCKIFSKKEGWEWQKFRKISDFIAVRGASPDLCSWAANQKADILLQPFNSERSCLDVASANVLAQNNVAVCFLFGDFLESEGFRLSQLLKNAAMALKIAQNSGCRILFASGAQNEQELRAAKDLSSFACLLGAQKNDALKYVRENSQNLMEGLK